MAAKIRLARMGKIRTPHYRIVVADSRAARNSRAIEEIGRYSPGQEPSVIKVDSSRALYWLSVGAKPTAAVEALLKITGDWQKHYDLPGKEGTLRVAAPKESKLIRFEAAVKEAMNEPKDGATTKPRVKRSLFLAVFSSAFFVVLFLVSLAKKSMMFVFCSSTLATTILS